MFEHRCQANISFFVFFIGDTMMLEADVSLGTLIGQSGELPYPIMAHPPETTSDLSLEMFLEGVLQVCQIFWLKIDQKYGSNNLV